MVPIRWTPPEAYKYKKYSTASDVWSYGITLYEIWTKGAIPCEDLAPRSPAFPTCSRCSIATLGVGCQTMSPSPGRLIRLIRLCTPAVLLSPSQMARSGRT